MDVTDFLTERPSTVVPPSEGFSLDDYWQRCIIAIAMLLASMLGLCGNSLVLFSVFTSKKLRTITNAFVVNLSIADFITCLLLPVNSIVLLTRGKQFVPEWLCAVVGGIVYICVGCSLYTLAMIAFNRLILITKPFSVYNNIFSPLLTSVWIGTTWMIPFCVNVIPPMLDIGKLGINYKYRVCGGKSDHPRKNGFDHIQTAGLYPLPLLIITLCYFLIYHFLKKKTKYMTKDQSISNPSFEQEAVQNSQCTLTVCKPSAANTLKRRQDTITKNMFYVVVAYLICVSPFAICLIFDSSEPVKLYASTLVFINSFINPILYGLKHPHFREVFKCILTGKCSSVSEQSGGFRYLRQGCC